MGLSVCVLAAPEIVVGAVVVVGVVVVAVAIKEELDAYERNASRERAKPETQTRSAPESWANRTPEPDGAGSGDIFPPPPERPEGYRRPECIPVRVPPKGGNQLHNKCADKVPFNAVPGANALVNGKAFDALQVVAGVLWEIKTDNFESYPLELQDIVVRKQVRDFLAERELARACGFNFQVGVRSVKPKKALAYLEPSLEDLIVVMDWC